MNTRRCIEVHSKHGLRCEGLYKHKGNHFYSHWGAMDAPIIWPASSGMGFNFKFWKDEYDVDSIDRTMYRQDLDDMRVSIHKHWPELCTCPGCSEDRIYIANITPL